MMTNILIGWVIVAFVTAAIAAERGRSFFGWLIIGLMLGVLALLMVCVFRRIEPQEKARNIHQRTGENEIACPHCGAWTFNDRSMCVRCGKPL